jgi:glutathione S-transferase
MKLYTNPRGTNTKRVHMYLAEKGIEVERQIVDFTKLEHRQEPFLSINPLGALPVLELDDGTIITESLAICRYFEELYPAPPLFGRDPIEIAQVEMWNRRIELEVTRYVSFILKHTGEFFKGTLTQVPEYADACRIDIMKKYDWLNGEMAHRDFMAGDEFTVADITAFGGLAMRKQAGVDFTDEHKNLIAWHARIASRPSAGAE